MFPAVHSRSAKYALATAMLLAVLCTLILAQEVPTFSSTVNVVNVFATVRDKQGNIVDSLTKEDFLLEEDGRPQTIRYFSRETDLPLTLGLLVDTSYSVADQLDNEKRASAAFINKVVRDGTDSAFLIHFDSEVELLQDVTSSRQQLLSALETLRPTSAGPPGSGYPGGSGRRGGGGTLLYDAIFLASDEMMRKQQGRKALIVLTDGSDQGSRTNLQSAIETAQRSDSIVYAIYFKGQDFTYTMPRRRGPSGWPGGGRPGGWPGGGWPGGGWPGPGGRFPFQLPGLGADGKKVLQRVSRETGGRTFEVSSKQPIEQVYAQIEDELRNQYSLGYSPDRDPDNKAQFHRIRLKTRKSDLEVQARDGYYASTPLQNNASRGGRGDP
ncbi:MAG: VWA domain-containing protein [Candidatus Korobacteraceae bacterium]